MKFQSITNQQVLKTLASSFGYLFKYPKLAILLVLLNAFLLLPPSFLNLSFDLTLDPLSDEAIKIDRMLVAMRIISYLGLFAIPMQVYLIQNRANLGTALFETKRFFGLTKSNLIAIGYVFGGLNIIFLFSIPLLIIVAFYFVVSSEIAELICLILIIPYMILLIIAIGICYFMAISIQALDTPISIHFDLIIKAIKANLKVLILPFLLAGMNVFNILFGIAIPSISVVLYFFQLHPIFDDNFFAYYRYFQLVMIFFISPTTHILLVKLAMKTIVRDIDVDTTPEILEKF